jgi:hypothetical protein
MISPPVLTTGIICFRLGARELESEPQVSYPSTEKSLLGYGQELTLEQGLQRTIDWVTSSHD